MDAHRKLMACIAVFVMLACMVPIVSDGESSYASGDTDGILLYEVNAGTDKGVSLKNYSSKTIDLKGYSVSDTEKKSGSEGYFTFESSFKLDSGETVTVVLENKGSLFTNRGDSYVIKSNSIGIKGSGSFNPGANGDDIYLYDSSGNIIDAVCYGNKIIDNSDYWNGEPAKKASKSFIQRNGTIDTNSAEDWLIFGQTNHDLEIDLYTATVTPFLFPDHGGIPVYQTLSEAKESIYIEIYMITNPNVYALLIDLAESGVDVHLLHSGNALGLNYSTIVPYLKALDDAGGDVKFILGSDYDRYSFVHCKYAIVDMEKVLITSENWTDDNCNGSIDRDPYVGSKDGNRGWGTIVESSDYAFYMKGIFDNDSNMEFGDVRDFETVYPNAKATVPEYEAPEYAEFESFTAKVAPVMSNDNSYDAIEYLITSSTCRIYSQQQNLNSYSFSEDSPIVLMAEQAEKNRNLDAKFILRASEDNAEDLIFKINSQTFISGALMDNPYVHNKGVISDDKVMVTSINWTANSVNNNREVGVIINSKEASDYYAKAFNNDFNRYYTYDGFTIDTSGVPTTFEPGVETAIEISVTPATGDFTYSWDFGNGQTKTTEIPRTVFIPSEGNYTMTITVTDSKGTSSTVTIDYKAETATDETEFDIQGLIDEYGYYIIPILVVILGIIGAALRHR